MYKRNPLHIFWLFPYFIFFGSGLIYSLQNLFQSGMYAWEESLGNIIIFASILGVFSFIFFSFRVEIDHNGIFVRENFFRRYHFLYSEIGSVYIHSSPLGRLFGLYSLIIELSDPKEWDRVTLKLGGLITPYKHIGKQANFPGKWGGIITIPTVTLKESAKIIEALRENTDIKVIDSGMFHPFISKPLTFFSYIIVYGLLALLLFVFGFWIFLNIAVNFTTK